MAAAKQDTQGRVTPCGTRCDSYASYILQKTRFWFQIKITISLNISHSRKASFSAPKRQNLKTSDREKITSKTALMKN